MLLLLCFIGHHIIAVNAPEIPGDRLYCVPFSMLQPTPTVPRLEKLACSVAYRPKCGPVAALRTGP